MKNKKKLIVIIIVLVSIVVCSIIGVLLAKSQKADISPYEEMVQNGCTQSREEWLISLVEEMVLDNRSAYDEAKNKSYSGSYSEWLLPYLNDVTFSESNDSKSIYENALEAGFTGTEKQWKSCFKSTAKRGYDKNKKSAFELCAENGFSENRIDFLKLINSSDETYKLSKSKGFRGSRAKWIAILLESSNYYCMRNEATYNVVKSCGYNDSLSNWIVKLINSNEIENKAVVFYAMAVENGYSQSFYEWEHYIDDNELYDAVQISADIDELYENAINQGFKGSKDKLIAIVTGSNDKSPYEQAVANGYNDSEENFYKEATNAVNNNHSDNAFDYAYVDENNNIIVEINDNEINVGEIEDYDKSNDKKIFCVIFKDYDDSIIDVQYVVENNSANEPSAPHRDGYLFIGWDKDFSKVTENLVVIAKYEKSSSPTISVGNITAKSGDKDVQLIVSVENNPGILGMKLTLEYNENVMKIKSVSNGEALSDSLTLTKPKKYSSGSAFCWDGIEISPEKVKDGEILVITLDVLETAVQGDYPIRLSYENGDVVDNDLQELTLDINNGNIKVCQ